jgi:SpoVK/Ycf46/Vps4 family AAA+-type ATPase
MSSSSTTRKLSEGHISHSDTLSHELDDIASMTPGFLSADLIGLFSSAVHENSRLEARASDPLGVSRAIVRHMANLVSTFRPTLLLTAGAAWHPIPYDAQCVRRLHGLKKQIDLLSSCVRYAFPPPSRQRNGDCAAFEELHALGTMAGVVLSGPAGSGKTTLARAATSFLPQGFVNAFHLDSSEIVGSVVGSTEQKLRTLFAIARSAAPTILVIENIDVLAQRREDGAERHTSSSVAAFQRILSTLLVELDGIVHHNKGWADPGKDFSSKSNLLVIATTSCISRVDPAILRPGRLEVHIDLSLPDERARLNILCDFLHRAAPHLLPKTSEDLPRCDGWLHAIAKRTAGWSGAEMHGLCNEAGLAALRQLQTSSKPVDILGTRVILSQDHFVEAMCSLKI